MLFVVSILLIEDNFDEMKDYSNWVVDYELFGNYSLLNLQFKLNFSVFNIKENYCIIILFVLFV